MECSLVSNKLLEKAVKIKAPVDGSFELTGDCIFNCKMCYVHNCSKRSLEMETFGSEKWKTLFSDCIKNGLTFALLTGGEPLLHKDFDEIYLELKKNNVITTINTNGYLLDERKMGVFEAFPPQRFNISLYGVSDNTYKNLCGVNDGFTVVDRNIKSLLSKGYNMRFNLTVTKTNKNDVFEIVRYAKENGVHIRPTTYIFGTAENAVNERLSPDEAARISAELYRLTHDENQFKRMCADYIIKLRAAEKMPVRDETYPGIVCHAGKCSYWVHSDGKFGFCGMLPVDDSPNVFETGFEKAWLDTVKNASEIKSNPICNACRYRLVCRKCHSMAECEGVTPENIEASYACKYYKALADEFIKIGKRK